MSWPCEMDMWVTRRRTVKIVKIVLVVILDSWVTVRCGRWYVWHVGGIAMGMLQVSRRWRRKVRGESW